MKSPFSVRETITSHQIQVPWEGHTLHPLLNRVCPTALCFGPQNRSHVDSITLQPHLEEWAREALSQPAVPRQTASHSPAQSQLQETQSMDFIKVPTIVLQFFTPSHKWLCYTYSKNKNSISTQRKPCIWGLFHALSSFPMRHQFQLVHSSTDSQGDFFKYSKIHIT